jgi:hypothetical protein
MTSLRSMWLCVAALALIAGCGDGGTVAGADTGTGDSGSTTDAARADTGTGDTDSGTGDTDSGTTDTDSGTGDTDSGTTDVDANIACVGVECTGYAAALEAAPRGATSLDNCVVQLHQTDCCGATAAYGINHAARTALCTAEATCVASYPDPVCSDDTITTDTGDTTTNVDNVRLRLVDGVCQTFVCESGPCRSEPGVEGGCAP